MKLDRFWKRSSALGVTTSRVAVVQWLENVGCLGLFAASSIDRNLEYCTVPYCTRYGLAEGSAERCIIVALLRYSSPVVSGDGSVLDRTIDCIYFRVTVLFEELKPTQMLGLSRARLPFRVT